ncbi:hypothetical protein CVIRNUC_006604 [Coccomyxa viridis]|uniref:Chaperone DnaJ C-terminal domain-containing protein n=1 Tax=Coccomyxa viridis TaxID=1274662 RepID=A0AAV1IAT4_9CHLO|nr:hypothetical protein CVIRNUC_006604 [Coccomyxa viridis]
MEPRQEAYIQPLPDAASLEACRPTFGASYFPDASAYITSAKAVNSSKVGVARNREQPWKAEQGMLHDSPVRHNSHSARKDDGPHGGQDAFMQLVTEQLGGSVFNFQGSAHASYCSSNEEMLSHHGASFSCSADSFTSNLYQQPYHLRPGNQMAEHPLSLTLEEIYHGGMKAVECPRTIIDGVSGHNMPVTELLNVRITPGVREGTRVVLKEQGDEHIGQRTSDVALVVREELHPQFERKGNDLLTRVEVPLVQALTCEYVEVPLLDGDSMEVAVRGPISPESEVKLAGMGMPTPEDPAQTGDLYVRFNISFPERINSAQKAQLKAALL